MSEHLNKKPKKGILKQSSSFDKAASTSARSSSKFETADSTELYGAANRKSTKFDEMNIIETLHPPDKDYGHMKIEEPKTPFNYYEDGEDGESGVSERRDDWVDPVDLSNRLESSVDPHQAKLSAGGSSGSASDEEDIGPEELAKKQMFESKRKAHYNEYYAVKLARKLLEQEEDEEDNNESGGGGGSGQSELCETSTGFVPTEEIGNE